MDGIPEEDILFWPEIQTTPFETRSERLAKVRHELQLLKEMTSTFTDFAQLIPEKDYMVALRAASYNHAKAFLFIQSMTACRDRNCCRGYHPVPSVTVDYVRKEILFVPEIWPSSAEEVEEILRSIRTKLDWLKERVLEISDLDVPTDDAFLLRFLRACEYDNQQAFVFIQNYFKFRTELPKVFKDFVPSKVLECFSPTLLGICARMDQQGRFVIFTRTGTWDPAAQTSTEVVRNCVMGLESCSFPPHVQMYGVVAILDMKGVNWNHVKNFPFQDLKTLLKLVQEYTPLKIRAVYIINEPYIVHLVYRMVRIFIKKELDDKINFLGSDLETLHRYVSRESLPSEYGGTLGPINSEGIEESLLQREEEFAQLLNCGYKCKT